MRSGCDIFTVPAVIQPSRQFDRRAQCRAEEDTEMAKPPLSMKPTGWFQVAWSAEIGLGEVQRMKYFGQEMVAWRAANGELSVMDAYCEHLRAHLGYGGHVEGD